MHFSLKSIHDSAILNSQKFILKLESSAFALLFTEISVVCFTEISVKSSAKGDDSSFTLQWTKDLHTTSKLMLEVLQSHLTIVLLGIYLWYEIKQVHMWSTQAYGFWVGWLNSKLPTANKMQSQKGRLVNSIQRKSCDNFPGNVQIQSTYGYECGLQVVLSLSFS